MRVLGLETTCDETAAAVVEDGKRILSNEIDSQASDHQVFGGVYPELACRKHVDLLIPVVERALEKAHLDIKAIDLIAVAKGPGLIGALLIGIQAAKALSFALQRPFIGVNHVEAHLYAAMMPLEDPPLPGLGLVVSGGHTFLVKIHAIGSYERIGQTLDDAAGEAFDKVAAILELPYPGGPAIEMLAKKSQRRVGLFSLPKVKRNKWDFSFSGLKTSVLYAVKGQNAEKKEPCAWSEQEKADIAADFQETILLSIAQKVGAAMDAFGCKSLFCGGGVCNNQRLRELLAEHCRGRSLFFPERGLVLDNAAMIAGLGYHVYHRFQTGDSYDLEPMTRIPIAMGSVGVERQTFTAVH